jgi:hypothetical protein
MVISMIHYSSIETSLIAKAEQGFISRYGRIILDLHTKKVRLAAVQFHILMQEMGSRNNADLMEYRVIAAKLRSEFGTEPLGYVMTVKHESVMTFGPIPRLWPRYADSSGGIGYWATTHEYPLYALSMREHNNFPLFVTLESLRNLKSVYEKQEQEALAVRTAPKKMQKVASEGSTNTIEDIIGSLEERKQAASGNCYRCSSPKPKGVICAVCGYISKGGRL